MSVDACRKLIILTTTTMAKKFVIKRFGVFGYRGSKD